MERSLNGIGRMKHLEFFCYLNKISRIYAVVTDRITLLLCSMADSFTQVYLQLVFSTYRRQPFITPEWKGELHKYITGILKNQQQVPIRINSMPDHIHILFGMKPQRSMSEVIREIKADSTNRVKKNGWANGKFRWQNGYALLSYSQSHLDRADRYIERQAYHHRSMKYEDEYTRSLDLYKIVRIGKKVFD